MQFSSVLERCSAINFYHCQLQSSFLKEWNSSLLVFFLSICLSFFLLLSIFMYLLLFFNFSAISLSILYSAAEKLRLLTQVHVPLCVCVYELHAVCMHALAHVCVCV